METIPDKPGLIITGNPLPLPTEEPPLEKKMLWLRWYMATTGASLKDAWREHKKRTGWTI
jgi:hypothetical protein